MVETAAASASGPLSTLVRNHRSKQPMTAERKIGLLDLAFLISAREPETIFQLDCRGQSPLHGAASTKCPGLLRLLLDRSANVNLAGSSDGRTALHLAALAGDTKSAEWLIEAKADPHLQDHLRRLPLELAIRAGAEDVQEVLLAGMAAASSSSSPSNISVNCLQCISKCSIL
eukprot:TRINITY_DN18448_c0_g1_i1.p1 TRINITY_DN18448_c0_g1~~TRINITY_DN18448_c0_g1_i1.p1  ORF type:complete len:173 (-),score=33.14 TRINITY_DN18448_c0_g1_i1:22-540(-)